MCSTGTVNPRAPEKKKLIAVANQHRNLLSGFPHFYSYRVKKEESLVHPEIALECKWKDEMEPKTMKWAFELVQRNTIGTFPVMPANLVPKTKWSDFNERWARYIIATNTASALPVGYAMFRFDLDHGRTVLYCYELHVEAEFRRIGLGAYLMAAMESIGRRFSMERLVLTVSKYNVDGQKFYRRLGYETDETSPLEAASYEILSKPLMISTEGNGSITTF